MAGWSTARIEAAAPLIFDFYFPIWNENHRVELEMKILRAFFMKEIGFETYELWKFYLESRMNEIMPYYNQLYTTVDKQYNWLWDTDYTTHDTRDKTGNVTTDLTGIVDSTQHTSTKDDITGHSNTDTTEDIDKSGTQTGNDDTTTSGKLDRVDKTTAVGQLDIVDKTSDNGTNNITDNTTHSATTDTSNTVDDTGTQTYSGTSDETKHLGEDTAKVMSDYPQAIIDVNGDYATAGEHTTHESDATSKLTSSSTTDTSNKQVSAGNQAYDYDTDYSRKQNTSNTRDYTRDQDTTDTTDYTRGDTTNGTQNVTSKDNWSEQDNHTGNTNQWQTQNKIGDGWQTNEQNTHNNQQQDSTENQIGWLTKQGASGARSLTSMLMEYRESIINIDTMIISELRDLFMTIY